VNLMAGKWETICQLLTMSQSSMRPGNHFEADQQDAVKMKGRTMSQQIEALRALQLAFRQRKDCFERLMYCVSTDPRLTTSNVEETNDIYRSAFLALVDLVDDVQCVTGVRLLEESDKTLDWKRFTLMGAMANQKAVANG